MAKEKEKRANREINLLRTENTRLRNQVEVLKKTCTDPNDQLTQEIRQLKHELSEQLLKHETEASENKRSLKDLEEQCDLLRAGKKRFEAEYNALSTRLDNKNTEIDSLEEKIAELKVQLEKAQNECLSWKIHNQREPDNRADGTNRPMIMQEKRGLFITDSIAKHIIADKLLQEISLDKAIRYTIEEATNFIDQVDFYPRVVLLQVGANDIREDDISEDDIVQSIEELVVTSSSKWPMTKIVISLFPPRYDDDAFSIKAELVNAKLKKSFMNNDMITTQDHNNLTPRSDQFNRDGIHLSKLGTKLLASNMRKALMRALNLKSNRQYSTRQSHGDSSNTGRHSPVNRENRPRRKEDQNYYLRRNDNDNYRDRRWQNFERDYDNNEPRRERWGGENRPSYHDDTENTYQPLPFNRRVYDPIRQ